MITPRVTRAVRVPDLASFQRAIAALSLSRDLPSVRTCAVIVPTRSAASQLRRTLENLSLSGGPSTPVGSAASGEGSRSARSRPAPACLLPDLLTRQELYLALQDRVSPRPRTLTGFEREVIIDTAAREAADAGFAPPFELRPGLIAAMLAFYDQLRRQAQSVQRFEALLVESLEKDAEFDRGARRLLAQTRFLAATFSGYEARLAASGAVDEHALRAVLVASLPSRPLRHVVVTVADWIADPFGFYQADFDLLTRLPGLETIDLVVTEAVRASGFGERLHRWLPGVEEITAADIGAVASRAAPALLTPGGDQRHFTLRDREEELIDVARRLKAQRREPGGPSSAAPWLDQVGVVFKRPLPYVYLARSVFGSAGIPFQSLDALPLAAEPYAATLDLIVEFVLADFTRTAAVALLRSPHLRFEHQGRRILPEQVTALDRELSEARYLGGIERLVELLDRWGEDDRDRSARPAIAAVLSAARELAPIAKPAPASEHLASLDAFLRAHDRPASGAAASPDGIRAGAAGVTDLGGTETDTVRTSHLRARGAILAALRALRAARLAHGDRASSLREVAADVRRWIEEQTFAPGTGEAGVHLVDANAARYGDFDEVRIVGLVDADWAETRQRNIFYPVWLLSELGWPPERERAAASRASFRELLSLARARVSVSTFTLDEDALVEPSVLLDEVADVGLQRMEMPPVAPARIFDDEALSQEPTALQALSGEALAWATLRVSRTSPEDSRFHGEAGPPPARPFAVSALEQYQKCPFKYFAERVLRLEEEPEDEEVMDPRTRGTFMHQVFQQFFERWQREGHANITPDNLAAARRLFAEVIEPLLATLPSAEGELERTRLIGSAAVEGLAEAVFRMEAERPTRVVDRRLEYPLEGEFEFDAGGGVRRVAIRGKTDRIDLLADATFRVIDYKLSTAPDPKEALQLPVYTVCARQRLEPGPSGPWTPGEAAYIALRGPRRVAPLAKDSAALAERLTDAQGRFLEVVDRVTRGSFPPRPQDVFFTCSRCAFASVCREDYVDEA